ncbi:VWA domain-containing protein [Actinokineospora sp. UTMC 2448]|uniref:VWA domain-containing protein n=1 Tax=Actinokineospora sp. UTMC 2448 TaxID=2268449 RepID=UPI0021640DF9|nr:VWA domain-containing protein [Actinokineospora sp. UTMC 2448]
MTGVDLAIEVHQNKYLADGDTAMHAVLTVTARGSSTTPAPGAAEVLLLDCSSSMRHPPTKVKEAKRAAAAAIRVLPDGTLFAVVRGAEDASMIYPEDPSLAVASDATRQAAQRAVARVSIYGGTAMGTWLTLTRGLFAPHPGTVRHAILLTDGKNESETRRDLLAALDACEGEFVCDARGIGEDWSPDELTEIVKLLRGEADSVVEEDRLAEDFRRLVRQALTKVLPELRLRIGTTRDAVLRFVKQVRPNEYDLTDRLRGADDERVLSLGSWSDDESRHYHLCFDLIPGAVPSYDADRQVAWVEIEGTDVEAVVLARWTQDRAQSTLIDPFVERYLEQAALSVAIAEGGEAFADGDLTGAERAWGRAVKLAAEQGNEGILSRLERLVEVLDAAGGKVRLRLDAKRSAVMSVLLAPVSQMGGTSRRSAEPQVSEPPRSCPRCMARNRPEARHCSGCAAPMSGETM